MEQLQEVQIIILMLPLELWKQIFISYYNETVELGTRTGKWSYDAIFQHFCELKSTSKQLNQQLNDEFFYDTIYKHNLSKFIEL
jgi:hypothetical protein